MTFNLEPDARTFLKEHKWGVLATGRRDGSPQQSMVGYAISTDDQIVISAKAYTAKWHNASRQPRVSLTITDGRAHLVIYGQAETISTDPGRAEPTASLDALAPATLAWLWSQLADAADRRGDSNLTSGTVTVAIPTGVTERAAAAGLLGGRPLPAGGRTRVDLTTLAATVAPLTPGAIAAHATGRRLAQRHAARAARAANEADLRVRLEADLPEVVSVAAGPKSHSPSVLD